jgi:hypothetical protein
MSEAPVPVVSPPGLPEPQALVCANCGAALAGEYCAHCGQRHEPHVHSLGHFAAEVFESITHADSRLWRTLWYLLTRPGMLTREFFEGRRVSYLPPFRLYLVITLVCFLVASLPEQFGGTAQLDVDLRAKTPAEVAQEKTQMEQAARSLEKELADVPGAQQAAGAIRDKAEHQAAAPRKEGLQDQNAITEFCKEFDKPDPRHDRNYARIQSMCHKTAEDHGKELFKEIFHNIPRAMFVFLPLLALLMKLLYWRPKRYYVEHLLLLVHNHAFVFLVLAIMGVLGRIPVVGDHLGLLDLAVTLYVIWYIFRGMRVYYGQSRALTLAKYFAVGFGYLCAALTVFLLTAVFTALTL